MGLRIQITETIVSLSVLFISMSYGVRVIALGALGCACFNVILNAVFAKKYFFYRMVEILDDLGSTLLLCMCMIVFTFMVGKTLPKESYALLLLFIKVAGSIGVYGGISVATNNRNFKYCLEMVNRKRKGS